MPVKKKEVGRPAVITPETLRKLEEVFALGGSDQEACLFAGIGTTALYDFQKKNPEFTERKETLKQNPILKARQEVIKGLKGNPELALKFLERKCRKEFGLRQEVEHSGNMKVEESAKESLLRILRETCDAREKAGNNEEEIGNRNFDLN